VRDIPEESRYPIPCGGRLKAVDDYFNFKLERQNLYLLRRELPVRHLLHRAKSQC
jgi:hypothetical protein